MNKEEIEAIEYFEHKIKTKLPLYEETYVDGKPYRRNILQLETNFTEEQANKTGILLNLIDKLQKENETLRNRIDRVLKKLDTGDYVAYTAYGDLLYEDIELIEILKGEKE